MQNAKLPPKKLPTWAAAQEIFLYFCIPSKIAAPETHTPSLPLDRCYDVCDVICTPIEEGYVVHRCESAKSSKYSGNRNPFYENMPLY